MEKNKSADANAWLQKLRQQTRDDLRKEAALKHEVFALQLKERERQDAEARQLLQECGLDLQRLDRMEAEEQSLADKFLQRVRPPVLKSSGKQVARSSDLSRIIRPLPLAGIDIVTNLRSGSEPVFSTESIREIKNISSGSGWGCGVKENPNYPDTTAYWWYMDTPAQSRLYNFWVSAPYSGFHVTRANDKWYNCKYVKTYAFYQVDVYQYAWRGADTRPVVNRRSSNINETGRLEGALYWSFSHPLQAGDPVTVQIKVILDVYAQGSGSYGELNFADGDQNYFDQPVVSIY